MKNTVRFVVWMLFVVCVVSTLNSAGDVDFARDVRPIFAESCYACHGPMVQQGGLRLDIRPKAGVIVPGDSTNSALLKRVTAADPRNRMPLGGQPLPAAKIELLRKWIDAGAAWPDSVPATASAVKKHWAFVPPVKSAIPQVKRPEWVRNPIDAFVLERLDREGLGPSPEANPATLLRRVSLDL